MTWTSAIYKIKKDSSIYVVYVINPTYQLSHYPSWLISCKILYFNSFMIFCLRKPQTQILENFNLEINPRIEWLTWEIWCLQRSSTMPSMTFYATIKASSPPLATTTATTTTTTTTTISRNPPIPIATETVTVIVIVTVTETMTEIEIDAIETVSVKRMLSLASMHGWRYWQSVSAWERARLH